MGNSFEYYSEEHINWMWWLDKNGKGKERKKIIIKPVLSILEKLIASFTKPGSTGEASHMGERMSEYILNPLNQRDIHMEIPEVQKNPFQGNNKPQHKEFN